MPPTECLFCRIRDKKIPSALIYEDEHAMAFLDITPRAPGHTIVIPKQHAETLLDVPPGELEPLFTAVQKVGRHLLEALQCDGMTIGINQGLASGQTVPHLHIHLIPRFSTDGGGSIHSVVHNPPTEPVESLAAKLKMV